jgi:opacity protein-like surface antigen
MFKKITLSMGLLTLGVLPCLAFSGNFYLGPTLLIENNNADNGSSYRGISPKITVGYGDYVSPSYYLAGELFGIFGNVKISDNHEEFSVKTSRGFGASFVPGVMINESTELYARIGLISTTFTDPDKNATGGQLGVGLQTRLTETWDIRAEYTYTAYRDVGDIHSPQSDTFGIGFIHKFG